MLLFAALLADTWPLHLQASCGTQQGKAPVLCCMLSHDESDLRLLQGIVIDAVLCCKD